MSNETIGEIKGLLQDPQAQMTTKTGLRLLLTVSSEMYEQMENLAKSMDELSKKQAKHDLEISELKSHNILIWIQKNPKSAVTILALFVMFIDIFVDLVTVSDVMGFLLAVLKKTIGA